MFGRNTPGGLVNVTSASLDLGMDGQFLGEEMGAPRTIGVRAGIRF